MAQPLSEHDEDSGSIDDFATEQPAVQPRYADLGPAVQPRHADLEHLEPVALRVADTRARDARSWFVGTLLVVLIVGGVWLGWRAIPPAAAPREMTAKPIASATVERQPIDPPGIVPAVPSSSEPDRAVSADRSALPLEKPRSVPVEEPQSAAVEKPRLAPVEKPRPAPVEKPRPALVEEPRSASVEKPRSAPVEDPRSAPVAGSPGKVVERPSPPPSPAAGSQVSPPMPGPATAPAPSPPVPVPVGEETPSARVAAPEPPPAPPATTESRSPVGASLSGGEGSDSAAIQNLLGRYRTAFGALDVAGVRQVWPSVNQRSLERAFRQLEEQDLFFFSCTIDVAGARAEAICVGSSTFIPTVGSRSPQSGPSQWNFKLSKKSAGPWLIDEAQAR